MKLKSDENKKVTLEQAWLKIVPMIVPIEIKIKAV